MGTDQQISIRTDILNGSAWISMGTDILNASRWIDAFLPATLSGGGGILGCLSPFLPSGNWFD